MKSNLAMNGTIFCCLRRCLPSLLFALLSSTAHSESSWLVGVGLQAEQPRYTDARFELEPFPYLAWESKRWHIGVDEISYDLSSRNDIRWALLMEPRFPLSSPSDRFDTIERDFALEMGVEAEVDFYPWTLSATALIDISGTHGGQSLQISVGQQWPWQDRELAVNVQATLLSSELAMHLYGVENDESTETVPAFELNHQWVPQISASYLQPLRNQFALFAQANLSHTFNSINDSPRVEQSTVAGVLVALIKEF